MLTFTVPKMLRPSFRYHPELFAEVSRLIYRLVRQFHAGAARRPIRSGGVIAYRSSGEFLRLQQHAYYLPLLSPYARVNSVF